MGKPVSKQLIMAILVGAGLLIFILVAVGGSYLVTRQNRSTTSISATLAAQMALSTPMGTPTPLVITPTSTPVPVVQPGNIWVVAKIEEGAIHENGFVYDAAEFTNLNVPTMTLRAQCMQPGWTSPPLGQQYTLNEFGVLVPIEGIYSPLQRFLVLP